MKSVILLSGGLDSAVLAASVKPDGPLHAVSFDYGQRHRRELWSAFQIARYYGASHEVVTLPPAAFAGSSLTDGAGDVSGAATVVPARNLVFAAFGVAAAVRAGAARVLIAATADDFATYPDCRAAFLDNLSLACAAGYGVAVEAPFVNRTKAFVVAHGRSLTVPFDMTWSCYDPQGYDRMAPASGRSCGVCGACELRAGAGA